MNILGFSSEHDTGIAFVRDGRILYAANEERFDRKKFSMNIPEKSFRTGSKIFPDFVENIDAIAVSSDIHISEGMALWAKKTSLFQYIARILTILRVDRWLFGSKAGVCIVVSIIRVLQFRRRHSLKKLFRTWGLNAPITCIDHHLGHAAAAYYTCPWQNALIVTLDSQGDGICSRAYLGEEGKLKNLHCIPFFHSPGHYYLYVTFLLGFKFGREGKVTGLAARGNPEKTLSIFQSRITFDKKKCSFKNNGYYRLREIEFLKKALHGISREDIAAGIQRHLEDLVTMYIQTLIKRYIQSPIPVVLVGGIFGNVKLNQCIQELPDVTGVYIYPHMGDGGLAAGAAIAKEVQSGPLLRPEPLRDAYLGPSYSEDECERALKETNTSFRKSENIARDVAKLLAEGKVVATYRDRMEYGPRALGNRSIIYQATDPSVNEWLNKRLSRSEFMPFAPILRKEKVDMYFENWKPCEKALEFMTITLDSTDKCKKEAPAVVHVDGTARPQIVLPDVHPFMDAVFKEYESLTGLCILINTSFNLHEEPIVCTPDDAIRAFSIGNLDVLAMESFIIESK